MPIVTLVTVKCPPSNTVAFADNRSKESNSLNILLKNGL